jgi:membrane protease YdiL (CAAX protease family)
MLLAGSAYGAAVALDVADLRSIDLTSSGVGSWILNLVVTLAFMTVLFLAEEIGWRGYLLPRIQQLTSWPVAMAHGAVNTAFGIGAAAVVAGSEADLAYVAGESGIATFAAVAVVGALFLARARVWRTEPTTADVREGELARAAQVTGSARAPAAAAR